MLGVILSWLAIIIVFLSLGDFFIFIYKKVCQSNEVYTITETFILGLCATTLITTITSIWLPTNIYILGLYVLVSALYWIFRRRRLSKFMILVKNRIKQRSKYQSLLLLLPLIGISILILRQAGIIDSLYYHQQNIIWNENFAVVPGLGNLEDRFAFNSNYMLLSALFSFRAIFGEGIYSIQGLLSAVIICQMIKQVLDSNFELKRIVLLLTFLFFIFTFSYTLTATSTDAIPNILSFYLITRIFLYPDMLKNKSLLVFVVPVLLITFKITTIPLCLLSLLVLIYLIKEKQYTVITYLCSLSILIVLPWLVRNIIISGYLVFPIYQIDLFSFDWKMPASVLKQEHEFITYCARRVWEGLIDLLRNPFEDVNSLYNAFVVLFYIGFTLLSPIVIVYSLIKRKISFSLTVAYIAAILIVIIWYVGGPDPRFIGGTLFAIPFICITILLPTKNVYLPSKVGNALLCLSVLFIPLWAASRALKLYNELELAAHVDKVQPPHIIFFKPISYKEQSRAKGINVDNFLVEKMNNGIELYISKSALDGGLGYVLYDKFPATIYQSDNDAKFQSIAEIEARGFGLQDGFREK